MSILQLNESFEQWRDQGTPLVLVTVIATEGSTYSKPGAQMLIAQDADYEGLLSGGCLEGDVVEHAREVFDTGRAKVVTYDMRDEEEDQLWGLGLGCNGLMKILLQALRPETGYQPFSAIAEHMKQGAPAQFAVVVESHDAEAAPGASLVIDQDGSEAFGLTPEQAEILLVASREQLHERRAQLLTHALAAGSVDVLHTPIRLPLKLLLLGGGPDAISVVELAERLGWLVTVADHRPAYVKKLGAAGARDVRFVDPAALREKVNPDDYHGAVIMSHHLPTDLIYLRTLAHSRVPYIGLLGPAPRRERLLDDLGPDKSAIEGRAHGPVGLDIGADTPEGIALSIVSQMHAVIKGRPGHYLSAG